MKNNVVIYVVCFIVGILFFTVLPNICGCNVTEGQDDNTCGNWDGTCDEGTVRLSSTTTCGNLGCTKNKCCRSPPRFTTEDFEKSELTRLGFTYFISLFLCITLVIGNYSSEYKDSYGVIILVTIVYFIVCGIFDYLWFRNYLKSERGSSEDRDLFHKILHIVLPGVVLIMGYTLLIGGFKSSLNVSDSKSVLLFTVKATCLIVIITAYVYYTIRLINDVESNPKSLKVDIIYSTLQPLAILIISCIFYILILLLLNRRRNIIMQPVQSPMPAPVQTP